MPLSRNETEISVYETSAGVVEIYSREDAGSSRFASDASKYASVPNLFRAGPAAPSTVASLPAAAAGLKGYRSYVTDSNAVSFTAGIGAVVAAGGSTIVPVFCDGTNWRIG